ncbi:chaperone protein ClpB1-like [Cornus florida]|uniref:chaperone protein ClpB1-like n=1 Tax=Cornus florida TaxID=4283 RepID=UPI002898E657|nr:chaperone protein ClpB1-like [Cornus florida]
MNLQDAEARADLDSVAVVARELVKILDDLKKNAIEDSFMPNMCKKGHLKSLKEELQLTPIERPKSGVQGLRMKLSNVVGQQHQAIDVVVETLLNSIDKPHRPAKSFLFSGLTGAGEADLVGSLANLLVADGGMNLLIRIDLPKYTESDSFLQFLNGPLELPYGHEQCGFSLLEAIRMRPHSILFFSQVEKAPMSVFSALLWILDGHKLKFDGGHTVDFRNTIVIFATDLGNKAILSRLVGHPDQGSVGDGATEQQEEKRGFRFELVNRVNEIVFFNPSAREQLKEVGRLSMQAGPHLEDRCPLTFPMAFMHLFKMANDRIYENTPSTIHLIVLYIFSKWLNNECSDHLKQTMAIIRRSRE